MVRITYKIEGRRFYWGLIGFPSIYGLILYCCSKNLSSSSKYVVSFHLETTIYSSVNLSLPLNADHYGHFHIGNVIVYGWFGCILFVLFIKKNIYIYKNKKNVT